MDFVSANSVYPGEMQHYAAYHLGHHCKEVSDHKGWTNKDITLNVLKPKVHVVCSKPTQGVIFL